METKVIYSSNSTYDRSMHHGTLNQKDRGNDVLLFLKISPHFRPGLFLYVTSMVRVLRFILSILLCLMTSLLHLYRGCPRSVRNELTVFEI